MTVGPGVGEQQFQKYLHMPLWVVAAREIPPLISNEPWDPKISLTVLLNLLEGCLLLFDVQERETELKSLQEMHSQEINELKQAKESETQLLSNHLLESTEALSALSCELKKSKRLSEIRENKLKAQAKEEISRMEKTIHQEKVSWEIVCA